MVLYFSATGNTEYIAKKLAKELNDDCLNLLERIRQKDYARITSKKPFVICSPVYVCEMPDFLRDFLARLKFSGNRTVYFVFTSGGYAGISGMMAKILFSKKKMEYRGHAEFKMPRNYIASDMYPELSDEENLRRIRESDRRIPEIAEAIRTGQKLRSRYVFLFEKIITIPFQPLWVRYKQPAKDFYATDACIGCEKCERMCPVKNISMKGKRPEWHDKCYHCMACIGNCPVEAIEYGDITLHKKKYNIERVLREVAAAKEHTDDDLSESEF